VIRVLVLAVTCALGLADRGYAQGGAVVEIGGGAGYVFGGGAEDPGPSLPAFDAIVYLWPFERWGVGVRWVEGPGEDRHPAIESLDRAFLGTGHLRYWTVTARHRRPLPRQLGFELGFGMLFGGEFASIQELRNPPRRISGSAASFNGFSIDGLVSRELARHVGVKVGLTFDFNFETTDFQPVALGVIRF
jgi:hypothetical protein